VNGEMVKGILVKGRTVEPITNHQSRTPKVGGQKYGYLNSSATVPEFRTKKVFWADKKKNQLFSHPKIRGVLAEKI